jgi:hypothetical protein
MSCTATTEDKVQNARNALRMLEDMKAKRVSPFFQIRRAIARQKKLIQSLENL